MRVSTFSFSVLKSKTGKSEPCMVLVLSMSIVRFSEKSICEYIGNGADNINSM